MSEITKTKQKMLFLAESNMVVCGSVCNVLEVLDLFKFLVTSSIVYL